MSKPGINLSYWNTQHCDLAFFKSTFEEQEKMWEKQTKAVFKASFT